jgi:ankyrin repeat protein
LKAFQAGNLIIAEHLLAECWVNIREDNLLTEHGSVMHAAVAANNADALIILMRRASNATNYKNRDGLTPLALAIKLRRKDMVVFFLKEGVAIDRQAVMEAIKLGDLDLLQRFAKRKVDVFCYLVESKRNDLISSLLNKPVSVSLKAVFVAVDNNNLQALQLFHHKGVPVFFSVGIKHSPLVRAIRNKNIRLVDFYVDLLRPNKASEGAVLNLNLMQYFSASLKKPHLYQLYLVSQLRHDQGAMRKVEKLLSGCKSAEPLEKVKHLFKCYLKGRRLGLRFLCSVVPRLFAGKIALLAGKLDSGEIASVEELSEKMTEVFFSESVNHHAVEADDLLMPMLAYIRVNLIKAPAAHLTPAAAI